MSKSFPKEFREDVIRVYKDSDASMAQGREGLRRLAVVPEAVAVDRRAGLVTIIRSRRAGD